MEDAILTKLEEIRNLTVLQAKEMLTVDDVSLLTGYSRRYVLKLAQEGRLPYYKPFGKQIFFKRSEIDAILATGRVASITEIINS